MTGLPWFKCDPRKFRDGLVGLSCEERGAYTTLIMLVYERAGPVPDDDPWIMAHLGLSVRAWIKVRGVLLARGKLFEISINGLPFLMDERAAFVIEEQRALKEKFSDAGKRRANSKVETPKNNDLAEPTLGPGCADPAKTLPKIEDLDREIGESPISPNGEIAPQGAKRARRKNLDHFVPATWEPKTTHREKRLALQMAQAQFEQEVDSFRNWEFKSAHSDWDRAFHTWLNRAAKDATNGSGPQPRTRWSLDRERKTSAYQQGLVDFVNGGGGRE